MAIAVRPLFVNGISADYRPLPLEAFAECVAVIATPAALRGGVLREPAVTGPGALPAPA